MTISVGPVELSNDGCDKNLRPGFSILTWDQLVLHLVYDTQEKGRRGQGRDKGWKRVDRGVARRIVVDLGERQAVAQMSSKHENSPSSGCIVPDLTREAGDRGRWLDSHSAIANERNQCC